MNIIDDIKPNFSKIENTYGTVQLGTTIYNSTTTTYNSVITPYGGITGMIFGIKPNMNTILNK